MSALLQEKMKEGKENFDCLKEDIEKKVKEKVEEFA